MYTKNIGIVWFSASFILTAFFYSSVWLSFTSIGVVLLIIAVANIYKLNFSIEFGRLLLVASVIYSMFFAIKEIPASWDTTIYNAGFANLIGVGLFLVLYQGVIIVLHKKKISPFLEQKVQKLAQISEFISIWFILTLTVFVCFYTLELLAFFTIACSFLFLIWGRWQSNRIKKLGYIIYGLSIAYALIWAINFIKLEWNNTLFSSGYINLIGIGIFAGTMILFLKKVYKQSETIDTHVMKLIINLWPLWFTGLYLVTGFYYLGNFTLNLAIIPMFAFIYWGHKQKLVYTEYIGIAYSFLIFLGVMISVQEANSLRFSLQSTSGKIAMIEVLFCMWFLKIFYEQLLHGNQRSKAMDIVRELFYWAIPLLIISPAKRHLPEFIGVACWIAVLANFIIFEKTKT